MDEIDGLRTELEKVRNSDARLRAFCEGLGMNNIDKLMTGTAGDFRKIGEVMAERISNLATRLAAIEKAVEPFVAELPEIDAWQLRNASKLISKPLQYFNERKGR